MFESIAIGVVSSVLVNLSAWWKNATADGKLERYELRYAWPALLAGVSSGLAANLPWIPDAFRPLVAAGAPVVLHNLAKGVYRRDWKAAIGAVTGGFDLANPDAKSKG